MKTVSRVLFLIGGMCMGVMFYTASDTSGITVAMGALALASLVFACLVTASEE